MIVGIATHFPSLFLILGFELSNWKWPCRSVSYTQEKKKKKVVERGQGSWVLSIVYIRITFLKEFHSQRLHICKFMGKKYFLTIVPTNSTDFLLLNPCPAPYINSVYYPLTQHCELQTEVGRQHSGLSVSCLLAHPVLFAAKPRFTKTTWIYFHM